MPPIRKRAGALLALLLMTCALCGGLLSTAAQGTNGAGLVIRHDDGTLVYAYVQFDEESIDGLELLARSEIDATIAPYGGLGGAVCSLNGEGCPSDDCFCHSYSSPSYYWHYFIHDAGGWVEHPVGPSSRTVRDGDIHGWSWTAGESGLPETSIDEIALMNGFDRSPDSPTPEAATPDATQEPIQTVAAASPTPTRGETSASRAVVVAPGATPEILAQSGVENESRSSSYLIAAGMAALVVALGGVVILRNRTAQS